MSANATIVPNDQYRLTSPEDIQHIIRKHSLLASGAGLIPILGVDVAASTAVNLRMIQKLAEAYGVPFTPAHTSTVLTTLASCTVSRLTSMALSEFADTFATFGTLAEELTNAAVSGFFTGAMGEIYKTHFEKGGTLDDFQLSDVVEYFQHQLSSGNLSPTKFSNLNSAFGHLT